MSKKTFRVYFIEHHDGHKTGILLRDVEPAPLPPPTAYGASEDDVLRQLEHVVLERQVEGADRLEDYLWGVPLATREVIVDIHPMSAVAGRPLIGKRSVPMRVSFAFAALPGGAYRVLVPRFGSGFVLEDLALAPEVLRHAIGALLLGENPRWLYELRVEGDEYVREWEPKALLRAGDDALTQRAEDDLEATRAVADDLVDRAKTRRVSIVLGALDPATERAMRSTLDARLSVLLVGGPGVGKSTWVRRAAQLFASAPRGDADPAAAPPRLWATSADRLVAGMVYLGMWQERCLAVAAELTDTHDYLYVDRLVSFVRPQPDGTSLADVFAPSIASGALHVIAECSESELEWSQRRFPTLLSHFQIVRLDEPTPMAMVSLLDGYQQRKEGGPRVHGAALKRLVHYLATFQPDERFPGKGVRFIDWLHQESPDRRARVLYPRDLAEAYSRFSGLPVGLIADDVPASTETHAAHLRARVIGQDEACGVCAAVLSRFKAGLNDPDRPCATLLFVGPTGVGKTELARQLAAYMFGSEERMIRLDMSEYMLPGSSARLLDAGRGVASLAQQVRERPLSLVLFDEIEKAHPEVFDLLLGVLGEGRLTDGSGRLVDFRMTLVVMTSNVGASDRAPVGFGDGGSPAFVRSVRQHFRPEFFNRIDHVVPFRALSRADVRRVVDLEIDRVNRRTGLVRRGLRVRLFEGARERLAELGYQPSRGARALKRVIEERVVTPLAARMASDPSLRDVEVALVADAGAEVGVGVASGAPPGGGVTSGSRPVVIAL